MRSGAVRALPDAYVYVGRQEDNMRYAYVNKKNVVAQFIYDDDPIFPGIPINKRYSAEFANHLVPCDDDAVELNWIYENGEFHELIPEPEPEPSDEISDSEALAIIMGEDVSE